MVFGPFAAKDKALLFRQMLSLAPQLWFKRDMGIGLPNLLFGSQRAVPCWPSPTVLDLIPSRV